MLHGEKDGRGRKIAIPKIVVDALEMPDTFAGLSVESDEAIGKEVVAHAIGPVEIESRGAGGNEDNAAGDVDSHTGPIVGGAAGLPRVLRPSVGSEFAWVRNGVKRPAELAGAHFIGADIARRSGERFGFASAHDHQVFINDGGAGHEDRLIRGIAAEVLAEIDATVFAESRDRLARVRVERIDEVHYADENPALLAIGPVGEAAIGLRAFDTGVELPQELAGRGIEGKDFLRGRDSVEDSVDLDGARLQASEFLGVKAPRNAELFHVFAIDLGNRGEVIVVGRSSVEGPIVTGGFVCGFR